MMTDAHEMTQYHERQWRTAVPPADVFAVPTMLGHDEQRLLFSLTQGSLTGAGAIIDAGAFLGGSTLALARGLQANPRPAVATAAVHTFDHFILDAYSIEHYIEPARDGIRLPGASCHDLFVRNTGPVADRIHVHHGDLRVLGWTGAPIEILFLDVVKDPTLNDVVLRDFLPALLPGAVLVQQDYVHEAHFWIHITMEYLADFFTFIESVEYSSTVYLLRRPLPTAALAGCYWAALCADDKLALMDAAITRWQGYPKGVVECARALLLASLGDREGARSALDRIHATYFWSPHVQLRAERNQTLLVSEVLGWE